MGSRGRKTKKPGQSPAKPTRKNKWMPVVVALFAVGLVTIAISVALNGPSDEAKTPKGPESSKPGTGATAGTPTPTPSAAKPGFGMLKAKWLRPDGGYVLDIKAVEDDGKLDASYSNPKPIRVSKAEASRDGKTVKVFIELRDVNYPGSTYDLTYDPQDDSLNGVYYQAALQQSFEVVFVRMK